ncbi:hypothetical protein E1B28_009123 [Marasmius oreades]|uniref:DNA 3'-5' helicase n=1 Tax=Marasmius oreades TaxID=181124 RepID=A0A9P7USH3_9AGAR|nr:uncharacterized protein E1B28_009123 [Marasmius oreades]KAG7092807.1 hypothetical protein E1B28_009123 [Marasmius oreades]
MEYWNGHGGYYDNGGYMEEDMPEYMGEDGMHLEEQLSDEIMNSSPSPPERLGNNGHHQQYQSFDDIEEYPEIHSSQQQAYLYSAPRQPYHQDPAFYAQPNSRQFYEASRTRFPLNPQHVQAFRCSRSVVQSRTPFTPVKERVNAVTNPESEIQCSREDVPFSQSSIPSSTPQIGKRIKLRPVSELSDMYRAIFKFGVFNAVQSSCFDDLLHSSENLVVSAPTGSGKTALFELSIIKMLKQANEEGQKSKCVYIAPTKALCGERYRDWANKFDPLGIKCYELTGDTVHFGKGVWGDAKDASIIVTTGEKWDSLTRNWADHSQILSSIRLFLVDEVHILNESRGSTLEVVVSRMKLRGSAVRFIVVSATVPNIQDIASWIGSNRVGGKGAKVFEFGEEFRPCKLTRHVIGVHRPKGQNDFVFSKNLDYKLFGALQTHSIGKPVLVFVSTRKGVFATAQQLAKDYKGVEEKRQSLPWTKPIRIDQVFTDKSLAELAALGIGVHHAGMTLDDRRAMEDLFLRRIIRVMVATSTLAVGVNLPAHTVVIKGVHTFQNNASVEYSDLDIMQMLGRAGRPQFDKEGVAIIICETELEHKYQTLVQGKSIVESSLQNNLEEHLNSEIGLGTITNITSAKEWLKSSFLYQRIQKNPSHYSVNKGDNQTWEEKMDDIVTGGVESLRDSQLIMQAEDGDEETLQSTEFGDIMSKFYIRQKTMCSILALPEIPSLRDVLEMVSSAEELSESKLRGSEKSVYNKLRKHNDIRFEVKKIEKTADKVFTLIQAVLGGISLNDPEYKTGDSQIHLEAFSVFRHLPRIARAIVDVGIIRRRGAQLKHGLELLRCFTAKAWENRPVSLKQLESIGEKSLKILTEHGITSLEILRKQDALRLEMLLNRRPPFGLQLLAAVREFPLYSLKVVEKEVHTSGGKKPVEVVLGISCGLLENPGETTSKHKKMKSRFTNMTVVLTLTSDYQFVEFRRIPTKVLKDEKHFDLKVALDKPSQSVTVYMVSETFVGVTVSKSYRPNIPSSEYPTRCTKPSTILDMELDGLEGCSDLFSMDDIDQNGDEIPTEKGPDTVVPKDLVKTKPSITPATKLLEKQKNVKAKLLVEKAESEKLPNGNYRCNHSCKDKTACRHLCCREGTAKPPRSHPSASLKSPQPLQTKQTVKPQPAPAKTQKLMTGPKHDHTLEDLEKLHKETNVEENLNMRKGHRLKLDLLRSTGTLTNRKKKPMPTPDFDIKFSWIKDANQGETTDRTLSDFSDDDDLPEADHIFSSLEKGLSHKRKQSSDTLYSDSEIDTLILPHEDAHSKRKSSYTTRPSPPTSPAKRLKTSNKDTRSTGTLFLPATSDNVDVPATVDIPDDEDDGVEILDSPVYDEPPPMFSGNIDDFTLDLQCLGTSDTSVSSEVDNASVEINFPPMSRSWRQRVLETTATDSPVCKPSHRVEGQAGPVKSETVEIEKGTEETESAKDEMEEEFAALEAWLNSSAVEIIEG